MSYALFWAEALLTSVIWTAMVTAFMSHVRRKWISREGTGLIAFVPLLLFAAATGGTAILKYKFKLEHSWFGYSVSLALAYFIAAIILLVLAKRPGSSSLIWPRGKLTLGLLTAGAVTFMTLWNMDLEVRSQMLNLRTEAGAMMLSVSPPNIGDSQNAAVLYQKAFDRMKGDQTLFGPESPFYEIVPNENHPATPEILKRHELTIKLLRRGAALPDARFDHDYSHPRVTMLLPELTMLRHAGELLWLHARYEQAHGNIDSAIIDVNAMFHLAKASGNEPIFISALLSAGMDQYGAQALEYLLPAVTRKQQLDGLDIGDGSFDARMTARDLQGAEAFGLTAFSDLANGQMDFSMMLGVTASGGYTRDASIMDNPPLSIFMRVFLLPDDLASFRVLFDKYRDAASQPYYKRPPEAEMQAVVKHSGLVTGVIVPAMPTLLLTSARSQAIHADAQAAIAITRYRLDHGNFPASLDLLVPDYLDEVPADPFDGKPLRLIRKGDEWIVYSIGPDGKDDGGAVYEPHTKTGDFPFVLKTPK